MLPRGCRRGRGRGRGGEGRHVCCLAMRLKLRHRGVQGSEILANVWYDKRIARIDPGTGAVIDWIDLSPLVAKIKATDPDAVLNGIAYDADKDRLFVTGKYWPKLFEIKLGR